MSISTGNTYFVIQQSMLFIQECQVNVFLTTCILQGKNKNLMQANWRSLFTTQHVCYCVWFKNCLLNSSPREEF